ncbi:MAG: restriction endonuclease, partial [Verrucomicrobiae bacterium]|nr:restriction endonuclease [Verrucomicrobiae bacterium]
MLHPSIRLEGSVLSADILDAIERGERSHQLPKDFGLDPSTKVKDEIADAWAAARAYWAAYQVKISRLKPGATGTTETRNLWMVPLLGLLGYQLNLTESEVLQGKTYRISHRDPARDQLPIHILGWHESLDRRSNVPNAPRMSPHGLVQEYLNLTEHLYGIVSNGRLIRLLRDSSRLVKLTFIEFDLERIFTEELFADFALFYRLLHASRLPVSQDSVAEAPIEIYHQDSLDSGSRIRSGLSTAVHRVILDLANGLLNHPANDRLRELAARPEFAPDFYAHL